MPGQGGAVECACTTEERAAMGDTLPALGNTTFDIDVNGEAFGRDVPAAAWSYRPSGCQAVMKWLSYRERTVPGRPQRDEEIRHFVDSARRIAAILPLTGPDTGRSGPVEAHVRSAR